MAGEHEIRKQKRTEKQRMGNRDEKNIPFFRKL